ncbi:MAG: molybdate ABC transporter substrate-binding protein [Bacillota bacterium]
MQRITRTARRVAVLPTAVFLRLGVVCVIVAALLTAATGAMAGARREITVGAGAGLLDALELIKSSFEAANPGIAVSFTFASGGAITAQVKQGAPLDAVVFPAGGGHMDTLEREGFIVPKTRFVAARDKIVLVVPGDAKVAGDPWKWLSSPSVRKIAIGDPRTVPAGAYAMQVLQHMGLDKLLAERLVYARTVRQVLTYVELGDADAGLVYGSTLYKSTKAKAIAEAPSGSHECVVFEGAMVKGTKHEREVQRFLAYLRSPEARKALEQCGFGTPDE